MREFELIKKIRLDTLVLEKKGLEAKVKRQAKELDKMYNVLAERDEHAKNLIVRIGGLRQDSINFAETTDTIKGVCHAISPNWLNEELEEKEQHTGIPAYDYLIKLALQNHKGDSVAPILKDLQKYLGEVLDSMEEV